MGVSAAVMNDREHPAHHGADTRRPGSHLLPTIEKGGSHRSTCGCADSINRVCQLARGDSTLCTPLRLIQQWVTVDARPHRRSPSAWGERGERPTPLSDGDAPTIRLVRHSKQHTAQPRASTFSRPVTAWNRRRTGDETTFTPLSREGVSHTDPCVRGCHPHGHGPHGALTTKFRVPSSARWMSVRAVVRQPGACLRHP